MAEVMRLLALLVLPLLLAQPALAQTFPALTGRVVDAADILPPDVEASIAARSRAIEQATGAQAVVATIPDLQGYPIEDYGYRLLRHWGIGQKDVNNGVILIVAPNERRVRVEVGYGLEPILTDALSSTIIQSRIVPRFRADDMAGGVADGFAAIADQLELPADEAQARARDAAANRQSDGLPVGAIVFLLLFLFWIWLAFRSSRRNRPPPGGPGAPAANPAASTGRRRRGTAPIIIWGPGIGGGGWGGGSGGGGLGGGFGGGGGWGGGGGASGGW